MLDRFNRNISYLRISVTDRCNLRCIYCMPEEGVRQLKKEEILSFDEIVDVVKTGVKLGSRKIRLTGGEPLVRKGIADLVGMIRKIPEIREITMTTNGILLAEYAEKLKNAGLDRINVSIDSVNPEHFKRITRGGNLEDVFAGIAAAKRAGLTPVKINVVKLRHDPGQQVELIRKFARQEGLQIRFISQMDLESGEFEQIEGGDGGNCSICNRLRLLPNGNIKPCLFSDREYNIREYGIEQAFLLALQNKPEKGSVNRLNNFYNIGG